MVTPVFMYETSPGESFQGRVDINMMSGTTIDFIMNRFFYDVYMFYVPFRLVWDEWPNFVSQRLTGDLQTIPATVPFINGTAGITTGESDFLWCKQPVIDLGGTPRQNALPWYVYNTLFNKFFRRGGEAQVAITNTGMLTSRVKAQDFHSRMAVVIPEASQAIPSTTIDDLRVADIEQLPW